MLKRHEGQMVPVSGLQRGAPGTGTRENHQIQLSQPFPGLEKRQRTVRAIIGPDTMTTRKGHDIFADQACEVLGAEGAAYDKRVDIYFQRNDWAIRMYRLTTSFSRTPLGAGGNVQREWLATHPGNPHRG